MRFVCYLFYIFEQSQELETISRPSDLSKSIGIVNSGAVSNPNDLAPKSMIITTMLYYE